MKRRSAPVIAAVIIALAVSVASAGPVPLVDHLVGEFSVGAYTATHQTIEDMGLGLYDPAYDQGYRGRDADRYGGTDALGNQECRAYLVDAFTGYGLTTTVQGTYRNVVGELTGTTRPEDIFIIGAHYDSTTGNPRPGGDDNASGTAAVVELARILGQYEFEATIRLIGFNTEEDGLKGSTNYVSSVVQAGGENVLGMVSLDMILRPWNDNDPNAPVDLDLGCPPSADDLAWVDAFTDAAADYVSELAIDPATPFTSNWGSSDHQPFAQAGYPAFLAIENNVDEIRAGSNDYYHQPGDASDGAAGLHYDYDFATDVTQAMAAVLAVEAGLEAEPILIQAALSETFVYQNTPVTTEDRNAVTVTIEVLDDLNGNLGYTTWVTVAEGPGEVAAEPTADPMVWRIAGGRDGQAAVGPVTLAVFVGGDDFGGEGMVELSLDVRYLCDITGDNSVGGEDKLLLNARLNGWPLRNLPEAAYDFNGDNSIGGEDKSMMNNVLNGVDLP